MRFPAIYARMRVRVFEGDLHGFMGIPVRYFRLKNGFNRNGESIKMKRNPIFGRFSSICGHGTAKLVQVIHSYCFIALERLKTIFLLMGGAAELGGLAALRLFWAGYGCRQSLERTF